MYRFVPDAAWAEPRRGSLYLFTLANPLKFLDPDGRRPVGTGDWNQDHAQRNRDKYGDSMGDPNNRPSFKDFAKALSAIHESASNFRYGPAFIVNLLSLEDGQRNRPKLVPLFPDKAMEDDGPPDAHVLTRGSVPSRMDGMGRGRGALPDLPRLDATGKVHGELPDIAKLDQYDVEDLVAFRDELQKSVAKRIEKNIQHGRDLPHGERQAAEQALIQAIDKHLKD